MTTVYKWRVRCDTDNTWESLWSEEEPIVCPVNTTHTINGDLTSIVDKIEKNRVEIIEESIPTGGHYQTHSIKIMANANTTTEVKTNWPVNISALAVNFVTVDENQGDCINMYAGKDLTIGAITGFLTPATPWEERDYTVGEKVIYSSSYFDNKPRVYSCIANTVANAVPINLYHPINIENLPYWRYGYEIPVTQDVIDNTALGYFIRLSDGANASHIERVVGIDKAARNIYVEESPEFSFSPLSPTYVGQRIYFIKDYIIDKNWQRDVGQAKIGGATIPANMYIHTEYVNHSANVDKVFVGHAEISY